MTSPMIRAVTPLAMLLATSSAWGQVTGVRVGTTAANGSNVEVILPMASLDLSNAMVTPSGGKQSTLGAAIAQAMSSSGSAANAGQPNGTAQLDSTSHLVAAQLPTTALTSALYGANNGVMQLDSNGTLSAGKVTYTPSGGGAAQTVTMSSLAATAEGAVANISSQIAGTPYLVTLSGATTSRSDAARASDWVNIADFGAVPDKINLPTIAYTIAANGTTLTAASGAFASNMVGKLIVLPGAGANGTGLVSVIQSYNSATSIVLATAASTALSGVTVQPEVGTDNTGAINAAIASATALATIQGGSQYISARLIVPGGNGAYMLTSVNMTGISNYGLQVDGSGVLWGVSAGFPVIDALGSSWIRWTGVDIIGDSYAVPSSGLQIGRINTTTLNSSDNSNFSRMIITGSFQIAALENEQSETTEFDGIRFYNHAANASMTYGTYAVAQDGAHHLPTFSKYITDNEPMNYGESFGENHFDNCIFGAYIPFFIGGTNKLDIQQSYSTASGPYTAVLYSQPDIDNLDLTFDVHSEQYNNLSGQNVTTDNFFITGGPSTAKDGNGNLTGNYTPSPRLPHLKINENGLTVTNSYFKVDPATEPNAVAGGAALPAISSVSMPEADIYVDQSNFGATKLFNDPQLWTNVSGRFLLPYQSFLNLGYPAFEGTLTAGGVSTNFQQLAAGPFMGALASQGLTINPNPVGVTITYGGIYYQQASTYAPTCTVAAAPSGGTTPACTLTGLAVNGLGYVGAGGSGYTVASSVPVEDSAGHVFFYVAITSVSSSGAVTGFRFANPSGYVPTAIPSSLAITQSGGSGGTITGTNYAVASASLSAAAGYTIIPAVTFSNYGAGNPYVGATGTAIPTSLTASVGQLSTASLSSSGYNSRGLVAGVPPNTISVPASGTAPTGATQAAPVNGMLTCSPSQPLQLPSGDTRSGYTRDIVVINRSGSACTVYPPQGGVIESNGPNVPVTTASGSDTTFRSGNASTWYQ